jgi:hypothetical protein
MDVRPKEHPAPQRPPDHPHHREAPAHQHATPAHCLARHHGVDTTASRHFGCTETKGPTFRTSLDMNICEYRGVNSFGGFAEVQAVFSEILSAIAGPLWVAV